MRRLGVAAAGALLMTACASGPSTIPSHPLKRRADEAFLKGEYSQAAHLYDQLAAAQPSEAAWARLQAGKSRNGQEDWDGAAGSFSAALSASPTAEVRAEALYFRSIAHSGRLKFKEALDDLAALEATSVAVRNRAVPEDEFRFRVGVTKMRAGDWGGGRKDLERLLAELPQSRLADDASDRLALKGLCIQIARASEEDDTKELVAEARSKGFIPEVIKGKQTWLVVTGRFRTVTDAQAELARVRGAYRDAFIVP